MPQVLLVNPRKRGGRKKVAKKRKTTRRKNPVARKKRRTAAQKAATRKMIAANRRRRKTSTKRRRNPVARKKAVRRTATKRRVTRRRRRNPSSAGAPSFKMHSIQRQVTDAGLGAIGALGLDVVEGYLPIPANLKTGIVGTGVKALLAIGLGVAAHKFGVAKAGTAAKISNGALTVVLHSELKGLVQQFAPGIAMGEYLDANSLGAYPGSGYNPYVIDDPDAMGEYLDYSQPDNLGDYSGLNIDSMEMDSLEI